MMFAFVVAITVVGIVPWVFAFKIAQAIRGNFSSRLWGAVVSLIVSLPACYVVSLIAFVGIIIVPMCPATGGKGLETQICTVVDDRWYWLQYSWVPMCIVFSVFWRFREPE